VFRGLLLSLISSTTFLAAAPQPQSFRRPLVFEPNRGQAPAQAKWIARGPGYQLFLGNEGLTMMVAEESAESPPNDSIRLSGQSPGVNPAALRTKYSTVRMKLTGSQPWDTVTGLEPTGGISNYLHGNEGEGSLKNVPHYARVKAAGVYEGVNLVLYDHGGDLEYDFEVEPGADPKRIQLAFEGQERMRIDAKSGDLVLTTAGGSELRQVRPKVYQQTASGRVEVPGGYELLEGGRATFKLAAYDRERPLLIDPTVTFTTFLSGSNRDMAFSNAVDSAGNVYVAGFTDSTNFPVNESSMQWDQPGLDAFVTKLSPQGTILFSTYLGGAGDDWAYGIAVDATGVYVTGATNSADFPHQVVKRTQGSLDLFVTKILPDGNGIVYTTILGSGTSNEIGNAIVVNPATQEAYVTGNTVFIANLKGDAIVAKLDRFGNMTGSALIGGSGSDEGDAIALDSGGNVLVAGETCSPDFPVFFTTPRFPTQPGDCAGFVAKWDGGLISLVWSRFWAIADGIAVDANNNSYVTGFANSPFSSVAGAFQPNRPSASPAYVTKFSPSGAVLKSTYLGGVNGNSEGRAITLNSAGEVYVAGFTSSKDFPAAPLITPNPTAGFLSKLSSDLSTLLYTRFLGAEIRGVSLFGTAPRKIYTTGSRYTGGVDQTNLDAFVVKLEDDVLLSQVLWQNGTTGEMSAWTLDSHGTVVGTQLLTARCGTSNGCSQNWRTIGTMDVNRDGVGDALWYNAATGDLQAWLLDLSGAVKGTQALSRKCGTADGCSQDWKPVGIGDFNHDGISDILWHSDKTGELQAWLLDGAGGVSGTESVSKPCGTGDGCWTNWHIIAIGDFNGDGIDDLFWYNTPTGKVNVAYLNGSGAVTGTQWLAKVCGPSDGCSTTWKPIGMADVNQDGFGDLLWENVTTGEVQGWLLNGYDRLLGLQSLSQRCDTASGCLQNLQPVGVLRDRRANP